MSAPPRVSVLIATRNRSETLVEAIESVLHQSFRDLEIIVADDGSTDDTPERITALEGPIHYVRLPESGLIARVRNACLGHARGELIAFLDDDDTWAPEKLARQVAVLDRDPAVGLVYTGYSILDEHGTHVPQLEPWQTAPGDLLYQLLRGCFIHTSTLVLRRGLIESAGGFDERRYTAPEYDLLLRVAPLTRGVCIADPLTCVRRGTGNVSVRHLPVVYPVTVSILEDLLASGRLDFRERRRCWAAISNLHVVGAEVALEAEEPGRARRHALGAIRRNPINRRAWRAVRSCVSRSASRSGTA